MFWFADGLQMINVLVCRWSLTQHEAAWVPLSARATNLRPGQARREGSSSYHTSHHWTARGQLSQGDSQFLESGGVAGSTSYHIAVLTSCRGNFIVARRCETSSHSNEAICEDLLSRRDTVRDTELGSELATRYARMPVTAPKSDEAYVLSEQFIFNSTTALNKLGEKSLHLHDSNHFPDSDHREYGNAKHTFELLQVCNFLSNYCVVGA